VSNTAPKTNNTILVVDDDHDIVQTIKGNLELDGYAVLTAFDGRTGLDIARKSRPDLMILDLNLPDIDGIKACQIIRREFDFPIIMLTARDGISDKVLGLECGADDYIVKPFNFLELSARIKPESNRFLKELREAWSKINMSIKSFLLILSPEAYLCEETASN
jgi:two-component system alkaline phosphatase synthesis response regulator PhoP/OmpR family response regulator RpaB